MGILQKNPTVNTFIETIDNYIGNLLTKTTALPKSTFSIHEKKP